MARLLIIDDDVPFSLFLQDQFTQAGFQVELAALAREGLDMAAAARPDLILLDLLLPDETGFQTCGKLRKNPRTHSVPVIMMSGALRLPGQHALARLMGANDVVSKPFEIAEILERIHVLLGTQHPTRAVAARPELGRPPQSQDSEVAEMSSRLIFMPIGSPFL